MERLPNSASLRSIATWRPIEVVLGADEVTAHKPKLDPINYVSELRDRLMVRNTVNLDVNPFSSKPTLNIMSKVNKELERCLASYNMPMSRYSLFKATAPIPKPRSSALVLFPCTYPITLVPLISALARSVQDVLGLGLDIIVIVEVPNIIITSPEGKQVKEGPFSHVKLCVLTNVLRATGLPVIHMRTPRGNTDIHTLVSYISYFQPSTLIIAFPSGSTEWGYRAVHGFVPDVFPWMSCVALKDGLESYACLGGTAGVSVGVDESRSLSVPARGGTGQRQMSDADQPKSVGASWTDNTQLNQRQEQGVVNMLIGTAHVKSVSLFLIKRFKFLKESILERMKFAISTGNKHISVLEQQIFRPTAPPFPVSQLDQLPPFGPYILKYDNGSPLSETPLTRDARVLMEVLQTFIAEVIRDETKGRAGSQDRCGGRKTKSFRNGRLSRKAEKVILSGVVPLYSIHGMIPTEDYERLRGDITFKDKCSLASIRTPHITNLYYAFPFISGLNRPTVLIEVVAKYSVLHTRRRLMGVGGGVKHRPKQDVIIPPIFPTLPTNLKRYISMATTEREITKIVNSMLQSCVDFKTDPDSKYNSNVYTNKPTPLKEFLIVWECIVIMLTGFMPHELKVNPHKGRPTYWGSNRISVWDDVGAHLWGCLAVLRKMMVEYVNVAEGIYIYRHKKTKRQ